MATTTNYGWTTPDDTDLVKDGAAAIRTLGSSVDTTTKNLNPETTTGDISYRSATANVNTRLPLGTAGQVLKVNSGATAPEWATDASGMTNPMTTTGDTIYSSSGSTPARLGIGTAGQVLKVNSGATAPEWGAVSAGSLTKVTSGTGTGVASITVDNAFTSSYKNYLILINGIGTASDNFILTLRTSGSDVTTTNYNHQLLQAASTTVSGSSSTSQSRWIIGNLETVRCSFEMTIFNPQENVATTFFSNNPDNNDSATSPRIVMRSGNFSGTNQFDGFKIAYAGGTNFDADVVVYGLEK